MLEFVFVCANANPAVPARRAATTAAAFTLFHIFTLSSEVGCGNEISLPDPKGAPHDEHELLSTLGRPARIVF
jgi:hypothetical protein